MSIKRIIVQQLETGEIFVSDAVERDGALWLVPRWLRGQIEGTVVPDKIVSLRGLVIQPASGPYLGKADLVLQSPLSKAALEGQIGQGLDVIERPDMVRLEYSTEIPAKKN